MNIKSVPVFYLEPFEKIISKHLELNCPGYIFKDFWHKSRHNGTEHALSSLLTHDNQIKRENKTKVMQRRINHLLASNSNKIIRSSSYINLSVLQQARSHCGQCAYARIDSLHTSANLKSALCAHMRAALFVRKPNTVYKREFHFR